MGVGHVARRLGGRSFLAKRRRAPAAPIERPFAAYEPLEPRRLLNADPVIEGGDTVSFAVPERTIVVTTVAAADADGDALAFDLFGLDGPQFEIDPVTLELRFREPPEAVQPADFDGDNTYDALIQVTDGNGGVDTQELHVTVFNVNDPPTAVFIVSGGATNVPAGYPVPAPLPVAEIFIDDDFAGSHVVSLAGPDAHLFEITPDVVLSGERPTLLLLPQAQAALSHPRRFRSRSMSMTRRSAGRSTPPPRSRSAPC
jgi:hypothetical protein